MSKKEKLTTENQRFITTEWIIPELDCFNEEQLIVKKLKNQSDITLINSDILQQKIWISHPRGYENTVKSLIKSLGFNIFLAHNTFNSTCTSSQNQTPSYGCKTSLSQATWHIQELACSNEINNIKKALKVHPDIQLLSTNILKNEATFSFPQKQEAKVTEMIRALGLTPTLLQNKPKNIRHQTYSKTELLKILVSGIFAFLSVLAHFVSWNLWLILILSIISILICSINVFQKAWISLKNKSLTINVLLTVAVAGAYLIGEYPEAAMVMFLFSLSEYLEGFTLNKVRKNIEKLLKIVPETIVIKNNQNEWETIPVENTIIGSISLVKPGDKIALDGIITKGSSTINESPITGESIAVEKKVGDKIFAGTINEFRSFEYQVTTTVRETTLQKIINLVENAQSNKAPTQKLIDTFANYYIPCIFILAITIGFIIPLLIGNWSQWLYNSLALLVISCPCALVISTPVTIISGLTVAAQKGILIKGGAYLELAKKINWLGMDKTGTITYGTPKVVSFNSYTANPNSMIQLATSLTSHSTHPLSKAIYNYHHLKSNELLEVTDFKNIIGLGTEGIIQNQRYFLVNPGYLSTLHIQLSSKLKTEFDRYHQAGQTLLLFCSESEILTSYALLDDIKQEVPQTIKELKKMGIRTMMITGDNDKVSQLIAKKLGITEVYSQQLPQDKLKIIKNKIRAGEVVAMVGDGINDAPALAESNLGIAMGKLGSDIAVETADIILMDDNIDKIIDLIKISKKTYHILIENISFAIGVKLFFIILTLFSLSSMWGAIFADVGATLLVILNGLKLSFKSNFTHKILHEYS